MTHIQIYIPCTWLCSPGFLPCFRILFATQ